LSGNIFGNGTLVKTGVGNMAITNATYNTGGMGVIQGNVSVSGNGALTQSGVGTVTQVTTLVGAPTAGDFTLTFNGQTTVAMAFNASIGNIQAALAALPNVGQGNVTVTGTLAAFNVIFSGLIANGPLPSITADVSNLIPTPATIFTVTSNTFVGG